MTQSIGTNLSFCGRPLSTDELRLIQGIAKDFAALGRTEIANTVCELLQMLRPTGKLKTVECRAFLESLEDDGLLLLPPRRSQRRSQHKPPPVTASGEFGAQLEGPLKEFGPLQLKLVNSAADQALWREWMERYHYLGYRIPFGAHLRYFVQITSPQPVRVGVLQFSSPAWRMAAREQWIGWSDQARKDNLQKVVSNSRFLILPWIQIRNLASSALGLAARRLPDDWQMNYGIRPVLLETLVDPARFGGTCYRAANWIEAGRTSGRGRQDRDHQRHDASPKMLFLFPLAKDARSRLCSEVAS
jgi:hypothetical protein